MSDLTLALRDEIRRLARKEVKAQTAATKQAVTQHRREIAKLKRSLQDSEKKIAFLQSQETKRIGTPATVADDVADRVRFSARSLKSQRRRLGLSAADYALLAGVSPLTIYNWEQGKSRPGKSKLRALVAIRGIGKREALAKLELLQSDD